MPKINLDSWAGKYSATPISEQEAANLEKKGYVIVDISDTELAAWQEHLDKSAVWEKFWKNLANNWLKEKYPELSL